MKTIYTRSFDDLSSLYNHYKEDKLVQILEYEPNNHLTIRDKRKSSTAMRFKIPKLCAKTFVEGDIVTTLVHDGSEASFMSMMLDRECCTKISRKVILDIPERMELKIKNYCLKNNLKLVK